MSGPPQPPRGGLSLYADLLEPSTDSPATISSAPVLYNESAEQQPAKNPALRFQPIRRPQVKQKPKPTFPKTIPVASQAPASASDATAAAPPPGNPAKSTLADWAAREEDEWRYAAAATAEKRQRGGRKKKKRRADEVAETDWDELYDPSRPTNVEEYLKSDERIREIQEWRGLLYRRRNEGAGESEEEDEEGEADERPSMSNQFAPPPNYAFAPPPPSPPREPIPDAQSGDDAYANRLAKSQGVPPPPPSTTAAPPPPPEQDSGAVISRAPVRYSPPPPEPDAEEEEEEEEEDYRPTLGGPSPPASVEPRSSRPGQEGFAQRLMSKYGWNKGDALGASSTGIATPLRVQVQKRRKRPDAEGGGWAEPAARAKIVGGERRGGEEGEGPGAMSEVIVLGNMLDGMEDLRREMEAGLGQEIGEECGDKYGRVERLYIDVDSRQVFIKFTDQVSALRAVNELKGRIFNGNAIEPRFFDVDKFESGVYR